MNRCNAIAGLAPCATSHYRIICRTAQRLPTPTNLAIQMLTPRSH